MPSDPGATTVMLPIVVADASVALKWFHAEGEEAVEEARTVLRAFADRQIDLVILDLTVYEIGNALLRAAGGDAEATTTVLDALVAICEPTTLTTSERANAARIARQHNLTLYDSAYAAVAQGRNGRLATMDRQLLAAGLGVRPEDVLA